MTICIFPKKWSIQFQGCLYILVVHVHRSFLLLPQYILLRILGVKMLLNILDFCKRNKSLTVSLLTSPTSMMYHICFVEVPFIDGDFKLRVCHRVILFTPTFLIRSAYVDFPTIILWWVARISYSLRTWNYSDGRWRKDLIYMVICCWLCYSAEVVLHIFWAYASVIYT